MTALPKMPPPDNFELSRGCLLSVLYLQLCICVFDIQPVNCQCCYWAAFIFMKSCLYFLSLATLVLNLKEWQRRVVLIKGCDALGEKWYVRISRSLSPALANQLRKSPRKISTGECAENLNFLKIALSNFFQLLLHTQLTWFRSKCNQSCFVNQSGG